MAEPVENGPSDKAQQVWERPWTLDEIRKNCSNWSLAADSGLHLYLQDFSQWMLSKTHEIEKQLDGLIRDTKATDSCLHTVFNDFLMLSNIQFIENRVYDEEVEDPVPKPEAQEKRLEQEKTKEQKESELIPKVQEAVNYGLKVLESAFEQLDVKVGNSDSEDEEAADRVEPILEPKDLYVDRPLPYLIGSQAFMEQDDVGLGDFSSDEMSIDSDRDIESEEGKDEEDSDQEYEQEEQAQPSLKKKLSVVSNENDEEENEDSDLFGESDKDEDDGEDDVGPTSFADELAARIKGDTPSKPDADRASLSSGLSVNKKKNKGKKSPKTQVEDDDEMFKPPEMDEDEFSPFGGKKGLFSGGTNLFDDDEGDLFSEAPKQEKPEKEPPASETTERVKTKKIPAGAVSIFPDNSLFSSHNGSDSLGSNEDGTAVKPNVQTSSERALLGGGLFDENDDDDFFSGPTLKKSSSATQEKPKSKKTTDLFGGDENDDGDGDIFNASSRSATADQPIKKVVEVGNAGHLSEKKSVPSPEVVKPVSASKIAEKAKSKGLFSDDEDSLIFPAMPKSHSKPEIQAQSKQSKSAHSIFDDDEEDLFSSVPKSESSQIKTAAVQPKKPQVKSSALFSDDEDQWMNSQPSTVKPEAKSGGMKTSTSAPSRLPSAKAPQNSLFNDDDDDLFAATKESSQKKPQRIALLFEDEDDAEKGSLFGITPPADKGDPEVKAPSLFGSEEKQEVTSAPLLKTEGKPLGKETEPTTTSPNESNKKKPAGAVSLFGGINVLGDAAKTTKNQSPLDDRDDLSWNKEAPPPLESKKQTAKTNTFSLFDDYDDDEEPDDIAPLSISVKPAEKTTIKSQEQKTHTKSTGVFQDEELLFSQTQLRDNDPEVDLFATSAKPSVPQPSSVKSSTAPTLFGDDDDDDLFSSTKTKAPPKVPVKPSKPEKVVSTPESPENEATLSINPASLMPGAGPRIPGAVSVIPGLSHTPSSGASGSIEPQTSLGEGVSFDAPAQVSTLQSTNKDRIKGSMRRRPQTRAARVLAAQRSEDEYLESPKENSNQAVSGASFNPISSPVRPSALNLPISTGTILAPGQTPSDETVRPKILLPAQEDLFSSEDLFAPTSAPKHTPSPQPKTTPLEAVSNGACKKKDPATSIFEDTEDLFATVKPKSVKKASAMPFLTDDDDNDIFGSEKRDSKNLGISSKSDIFQDKKETQSKVKKLKEPSLEASLFDDDVDIFADFTSTTKPKEPKLKKKVETKSIFDDDMDDIFSSGTTKPVVASYSKKPKKPTQESSSAEESGKSIFDDPLNVFGN